MPENIGPTFRYARLHQLFVEAVDKLHRDGVTYEHPRGLRLRPELSAAIRLSAELRHLEKENGIGDRAEEDDPIAQLVDPAIRAASGKLPATSSGRRARGQQRRKTRSTKSKAK